MAWWNALRPRLHWRGVDAGKVCYLLSQMEQPAVLRLRLGFSCRNWGVYLVTTERAEDAK